MALARALLSDPAVLFVAEPTSGLDPVASKEVHDLIAALKDRANLALGFAYLQAQQPARAILRPQAEVRGRF